MPTAIVLFQRDLRIHDNAALLGALASADRVIPVYLHDLSETGEASRWWLHHSLECLEKALSSCGACLVIRHAADPVAELLSIATDTAAGEVHWNRLYEPAATAQERHRKRALNEAGIAAFSHGGHLLHEPGELRTRARSPFRVFTPFWKTLQSQLRVAEPKPAPGTVDSGSAASSLAVTDLDLLPRMNWASGLDTCWEPGEAGALKRLRTFTERDLGSYARGRDYPSEEHVSRLSPHLHFGELTPAQVWHAVLAAEAPDTDKEAYLRELGFREFAHHVLFNFPQTVTEPMYGKYRDFPWREAHGDLLQAWQKGRTGYPIVDAGMRQLWQTGWMHNRVRMIVASLLVKNLRVPWQKGAAWFMDTLVDADLANNTFNWQWAAGCGADAAPYFRIFNPVTQSKRFEAEGYIREFVPELRSLPDKWIHKPWEVPEDVQRECGFVPGRDYPLPVVDYRESRAAALDALRELNAG